MSHYLYLKCASHDPKLRSDDKVGNRLSDIPAISADLRNREELVKAWNLADYGMDLGFLRNSAVGFLAEHPKCEIELWDEYGDQHPFEDEVLPTKLPDIRPLGENVTMHAMYHFEPKHEDGRYCAFHHRLSKWATVDADGQYTLECTREHTSER